MTLARLNNTCSHMAYPVMEIHMRHSPSWSKCLGKVGKSRVAPHSRSWLYQTEKSWFRRCLTYCDNCFSLNHASYDPFSSYSKSCLTRISNATLVSSHVRAEHGGSEPQFTRRSKGHTCLTEHHGTCVKCWPSPISFSTGIS